jgi:hypothetical protein
MSTDPNTPSLPTPLEPIVEEVPVAVVEEVQAPTGCLPIGEFFAGLFGRRRERPATPRMVAKGMSLDAKDAANRFGI